MEPPNTYARKWIVTGIVIGAFLVVDFITPLAMDFWLAWPVLFLMGVCFGQVNLIATWAALAPGNVVVRLPWALLLLTLTWYGLVLGSRCASPVYFSFADAALLGICLFVGVASAQVPLWIAGRLFRWRLVSWGGAAGEPSDGRLQFQLGHMMLGMLFVSIALAPGRVVLPPGDLADVRIDSELPILLPVVVACNLLIAVPCIWGAFRRKEILGRLIAAWLGYCLLVTAAELAVLVAFLGPAPTEEVPSQLYVFNLAQCATVFGTLLLFRALGFRLVRLPSPGAQAAGP